LPRPGLCHKKTGEKKGWIGTAAPSEALVTNSELKAEKMRSKGASKRWKAKTQEKKEGEFPDEPRYLEKRGSGWVFRCPKRPSPKENMDSEQQRGRYTGYPVGQTGREKHPQSLSAARVAKRGSHHSFHNTGENRRPQQKEGFR